jgi:hypothetical protein
MAPKPTLTDDNVLEIVRLHERGLHPDQIAPQFGRAPGTIRSIVTGKSYRHVTGLGHRTGPDCDCYLCLIVKREEANLNVAESTCCAVHCLGCQKPMRLLVTTVLRDHGAIRCTACGGRRK